MKNFDLAAAKAGAPVCTRSGKPARIVCWDMKWESGKMGDRIVYLTNYNGDEHLSSCLSNGAFHGKINDSMDLMMRDDDYAEKLARGEYGPTVKENLTVDTPTCKESLPVDREYWRRVYAGQIMPVVLYAAITTGAKVKDEYKDMPADVAIARSTITLADALIAELEKK